METGKVTTLQALELQHLADPDDVAPESYLQPERKSGST